ncbi:hypothetical protein [Actinomyces faecalis]|uniref:hypothetical protein n=1 Tax=Actinomyces faecalis TaxID=2722820 RepID=UPI00155542E5|nr:hypothetical protein [Actinomyces faecalis]
MTTPTQQLADLRDWLPELITLEQARGGPRSPLGKNDTARTATRERIPFGILVDDPDEPVAASTSEGIRYWAGLWQHLTYVSRLDDLFSRDVPVSRAADTMQAEAARLSGHDPFEYLAVCAPATPDWDSMCDELAQVHARVARRLGYAAHREGWCVCGGSLWRQAGMRGLSDWLVCDGPGEHWWPSLEAFAAARLAKARAVTAPGHWVTRAEALALHPGLSANTLKAWGQRGTVDTQQHGGVLLYDLGQVNARTAAT